MTKIKIPFTKTKAEKISDPNIPVNIKGLKLEVDAADAITNLNKFYDKVPLLNSLKKITIAFFDDVETEIYNELLDNNKVYFELSWEKEKLDFVVFENGNRDNQNKGVRLLPVSEEIEIILKPESVGVIKISSTSQDSPKPQDSPDNQKKIAELQARIKILEQKQSQNSNADNSEQTKQELTQLKSELATLKAKQNEQHDKNPQPNDFPWMAIGGGIVIVILLLIIVFLSRKTKR